MKVSVNDIEIFTLNETQKSVIKNDILADEFDQDMCRRLHYILNHKYERCFERLKKEWEPKLAASGAKSIPTDPEEFAKQVFAHPDYKDRATRDAEDQATNLAL